LKAVFYSSLISFKSGGTHYVNPLWKIQQPHSTHQAYYLNVV
jgi:hypothetical protein